jgi:hypothetical protein
VEKEKPLAMAPAQVALHDLQQTIKSNIGAVVAAAIVLVILVVLGVTAKGLQAPSTLLDRRIDAEVVKATQRLNSYEPGGQQLMARADAATSQPETGFPSEDQWPAGLKSLQDRISASENDLQPLRSEFNRLAGGRPKAPQSMDNYAALKQELDKNLKLISEALTIVQKAVDMSEGSAENTVSGRSHPVATHLEAVLIYHQADLLRRQAAMERDEAVAARARFEEIRGRWQLAQSQITAIEAVITGQGIAPTTGPAATSTTGPARAEAAPKRSAATPAKRPAAGGGLGAMDRLSGLLFGAKSKKGEPPATEPSEPPATEKAEEPAPAPAPEEPPPPPVITEKPPTPEQRLKDLGAEREKVLADIAAAEADVARLAGHKATLEQALAAARKAAKDAQLRMMQLKEKGVDPVEPGAMERFMAEYRKASNEYRAGIREAAILEKGGVRNAKPDTEDERELLTAPLAAANPNEPMKPSEGLIAVRDELAGAEARLAASKEWLASVDTQVQGVHRRQAMEAARLASLHKTQAGLKEEATKALRTAEAAAAKADDTALKAVDLLTTQGKRAAQNAQTAASGRIRQARDEQVPGKENARLDLITKSGFLVGYAETLEGDLALMTAYIQAERAADLQAQEQILDHARGMGIALDQQGRPGYVYQPDTAAKEAGELKKQAIAAADEAGKVYYKADAELKNLWVVQANAAAVHHLLAVLKTGPDAEKDCNLAIQIYEQALQDRKDRPEAVQFRLALEGLNQLQQTLAKQ